MNDIHGMLIGTGSVRVRNQNKFIKMHFH